MVCLPDFRTKVCYLSSRLFEQGTREYLVDEYHKRGGSVLQLGTSSLDIVDYLKKNDFELKFIPGSPTSYSRKRA